MQSKFREADKIALIEVLDNAERVNKQFDLIVEKATNIETFKSKYQIG